MSFVKKITLWLLSAMIPIVVLITWIIADTNSQIEDNVVDSMLFASKEIGARIDDTVNNVYSISDTYASEPRLLEYLEKSYLEYGLQNKQSIVFFMSKVFDGYYLLNKHEQISAIYTYKDELFNFMEPNLDDEDIRSRLLDMDIDNKERLGKLCWYPIRENFLVSEQSGHLREDQVIYGTRRVFLPMKSRYAYIHIFAISEISFYEKYIDISEQMDGEVYILNELGQLISTSDESTLKAGQIEEKWVDELLQQDQTEGYYEVEIEDEAYYIAYSDSRVNGWQSVIVISKDKIMGKNMELYSKIIWIVVICLVATIITISYMYFGFMNPINRLIRSMEKVYHGDLDQEIELQGQDEVQEMFTYYNSMLRSIKHNIKEKLESDKRKKEMELEVLMSQVNPHFLYNTLESIVWMAVEANRPDIRQLAASLGKLYRLSVGDGEEIVPVNKELQHVIAYCDIQKIRFKETFNFTVDTRGEDLEGLYTIKMILQPIVENIFKYAIESVEHPIDILLSIEVDHKEIKYCISDNGSGMSPEKLCFVRDELINGRHEKQKNKRSSGIGLHSVYNRLKIHYQDDGNLEIDSEVGKGTLVIVTTPRIDNKEGFSTI